MRKTPLLAVVCSIFLLGTGQAAKADELPFKLDNPEIAITASTASTANIPAKFDRQAADANLDEPSIAAASLPSAAKLQSPAELTSTARPAEEREVLDFDLQTSAKIASAAVSPAAVPPDSDLPDQVTPQKSEAVAVALAAQPLQQPDALFENGADSIVARTVGHAEGTRAADGQKTSAYYGHVDPGNAHWNIGSFSYQHCDQTCTPETADERQLARLKRQTEVLQQRAAANNLTLTVEEALNGIDLANQAPLAALSQGGYIDWLKSARQRGLTGSDAVLWARTWSFLNPQTQTWDAPGLGNQYESISHDQDRRLTAIARALSNYYAQRQ